MNDIQRIPIPLPLPFSRAVKAGGFVFLSGQIPMDQNGNGCKVEPWPPGYQS